MYRIIEKKPLSKQVTMLRVEAPNVAKKALPGQFIVLRAYDDSERIPLTIADYDRNAGIVTIIFQIVGEATSELNLLKEGEYIHDFAGPLGTPSHLDNLKRVCVIGGGLGCAIAYPQAKYLHEQGANVDIIAGFKNKDIIILEEEMKGACQNLIVCTDDGSNGRKNLVTDELKALLDGGNKYDEVIAIGPLMMMKFVSLLTKEYGVKTTVSMNPIMIDGTGMCGGCRLTVGGKTKFACVDGPDFDGHLVDFDECIRRGSMYAQAEKEAFERHKCNLEGVAENA